MSKPVQSDKPEAQKAYRWEEGDLAVNMEIPAANLKSFPFIRLYQGWIPSRFSDIAARRFSFVHIDVDIYEPTRDSLEFFYDRMVPGGIIVCDDYGFITCPGAKQAFDEFAVNTPERNVIMLTTGQGILVKHPA